MICKEVRDEIEKLGIIDNSTEFGVRFGLKKGAELQLKADIGRVEKTITEKCIPYHNNQVEIHIAGNKLISELKKVLRGEKVR